MLLTDTPYLTIEEASELLRIHPDTVRRLIREKRLPGRKLGREWRISREVLDKFMKEEDHKEDESSSDE